MKRETSCDFFSPIAIFNVATPRFANPKSSKLKPLLRGVLVASAIALTACQPAKQSQSAATAASQGASTTSQVATSGSPIAQDELQLLASDVLTAKAERYQPHVLVTGTLQVSEKTAVQSTVNAQVQQVLADVGSRVQQGQPLIKLDISGSQDQLVQAQANLAGAEAQAQIASSLAQKNKILFEQGFVSQIEYQRSVAEATAQQQLVRARLAQLNTAKRTAGDTTIVAPAAGVIGSRSVQVGQVVAPNQPLMEIINPDKLEFAANVPSEAQSQLSIGQSVPFMVANEPTTFVGQISRISPQVDATTRQLTIYVRVKPHQDNANLRAGMFATGRVDYGQMQVGVLIPMSAVTLSPTPTTTGNSPATSATGLEQGTVWIVGQDKRLRQQPITVIRRDDKTSQYLATGIEQGTIVVTAQLPANASGKKVVLK